MTAPDRFEDRLLAELREVVAARPAPEAPARSGSWRGPVAIGGAGAVAATAAVLVIAGGGDMASPAYAVDTRPDGSVSVQIRRPEDAAGLQRELREAGVPAVVDYGRQADCTVPAPAPADDSAGEVGVRLGGKDAPEVMEGKLVGRTDVRPLAEGGVTFIVDPEDVGPDSKVYIVTLTEGGAEMKMDAMPSVGLAIGKDKPLEPCEAPAP